MSRFLGRMTLLLGALLCIASCDSVDRMTAPDAGASAPAAYARVASQPQTSEAAAGPQDGEPKDAHGDAAVDPRTSVFNLARASRYAIAAN